MDDGRAPFSSAIPRVLGGDGDATIGADHVTAFYGTDRWQIIRGGRATNDLSAAEAREEYVNLYRWRLENVLGYRMTHSFEVKNTGGSSLYHLILATDNTAGSKIMSDIYRTAANTHEAMRREALERLKIRRAEERGRPLLFDVDELTATSPRDPVQYVHEPPWGPYAGRGR